MRIAIAALGTHGDVLPFVVLGRGLVSAGHDVLLSTNPRFRTLVQDAGLSFHAVPGDPDDAFADRPIDVSPWRPIQHLRAVHAAVDTLVMQADPAELRAAWSGRDHVVFSGSTTYGFAVAAELGIPSTMVAMTPMIATGAFAAPVLAPHLRFGRAGNLASWLIAERLQRQTFKEPVRPSTRTRWGLPASPLGRARAGSTYPPFALVHAYSAAVCPRPVDWPGHVTVGGWLLPELSAEPLSAPAEEFLAAGPPPLYIGFGSMPVPDPDGVAAVIIRALECTGLRAIVAGPALAGSARLSASARVLAVTEVAHERLFQRVRAVVHHGGSGTVGAGLRAGRPTLVTPVIFDQFFWGERVRRLAAGPRPLAFSALTEDALTRRLSDLTSGRYDDTAARLGERIRSDDPVTNVTAAVTDRLRAA